MFVASFIEIPPLSRDIASREIGANPWITDGWTAGWTTWTYDASAAYC